MELSVNLSFNGLDMLFKEYEGMMLRYMWTNGAEPSGSGKLWEQVSAELQAKKTGKKTISRASVIFAANRFVSNGIWDFHDATGKGGHHRNYFARMSELELWQSVKETVNKKIDNLLG